MDIVRFAIAKPVTVTVGVILLVMFGLIGLGSIPIQLTPTVDRPIVQIQTNWPGRSPEEIVDEITKEQEERLKNVPNLRSMRSITTEGRATITLEFHLGTPMSRALQEVSDRLRQVSDLPADADEPAIRAAEGAAASAIAWIIVDLDPAVLDQYPDFDITTLFDPLDKEVRPFLERTDGVAQVNVFGGRPLEMHVLIDLEALADRQLSHREVIDALRAENRNISAGTIAEGKRDYRIRVIGQFASPREILDTVITYRDGKPVFIHDVAEVRLDYAKQRGFVRSFGHPSIAINIIRQSGSNVMNVMHGTADRDGIIQRLETVRKEILPTLDPVVGKHLRMRQVYDETVYIDSAMALVRRNLWIGGLIAAGVLLIFLRSFVSTGVIALAIPISVVGTFLVMLTLGRTLNVISLAGIAFAVGMVVDNAIVVLENIYRRIEQGQDARSAALQGGREVWGAILASTLTTVAVFIPILTIQEEVGQLFRDLALAIVAAVSLSLVISITVIPAACSRWLHPTANAGPVTRALRPLRGLFGLASMFGRLNHAFARLILWLSQGWRGWSLRPALIALMTAASLIGAAVLMPPLDYLPAGNRNLVFGGLLIPPGYSVEQRIEIARRLEATIKPYAEADQNNPESLAKLDPITRSADQGDVIPEPFEPVAVENFFIGAFGTGMFIGATSQDPQVVLPIGQMLTNAMTSIPDSFGGARQTSIFGRGVGGGNTIDIEFSGPDLARVTAAADMAMDLAGPRYTWGNVRPDPANFNLSQQEIRVRLNNAGRELGLRTSDIGTAIRALFDGVFVDDYRHGRDAIDLLVLPAGGRLANKEQIASIPIATPMGVVPIDTIVDITPALAPQEIQRIEQLPSVTLRITPPTGRPLEAVMTEIRDEILAPVYAAGLIDPTMRIRLEGTAAKLDEVRHALFGKAPDPQTPQAGWQPVLRIAAWGIAGLGAAIGVFVLARARIRRSPGLVYGSVGAVLLSGILAGLMMLGATQPQLGVARLVWALLVTYLLMAALFESFLYPLVIMFSVPLAIVGGFAGLRIVHERTLADPTIAPQQLDVLTMIGFVILVGVVVNNAILLVHQSLNLMRGSDGQPPMDAHRAIAESVRTRVRPIFMSVLTSVGGMLPLVLYPGAGSEMYRGLGSVVIGGLLVSTVFTLLLVPLLFSLVLDMRAALASALSPEASPPPDAPHTDPPTPEPEPIT